VKTNEREPKSVRRAELQELTKSEGQRIGALVAAVVALCTILAWWLGGAP
jgi:hypothetical protein